MCGFNPQHRDEKGFFCENKLKHGGRRCVICMYSSVAYLISLSIFHTTCSPSPSRPTASALSWACTGVAERSNGMMGHVDLDEIVPSLVKEKQSLQLSEHNLAILSLAECIATMDGS